MSQCHSAWTALQPMFYGLRLISATWAFRVDCCVKLIGVSLEEGGVHVDQLKDGREERRRVTWRKPNSRPAIKTSWFRPPLFCSGKAVGQLEFGG